MNIDLIKEFNLPSYTKGKSFADASKAIEAKFKGRTDKVSNETKQELLERLSQAQEYLKSTIEQPITNEMANGGFTNTTFGAGFQEGADVEAIGGTITSGLGMLTTGVDLANTAFGKTGIDTSGRTAAPELQSGAGAAFGSAMKGASAGAALGPLGAAGGALLGGVAGLLGNNKAKKDAERAQKNFDLKQSMNYAPNDYAFGGFTDPTKKKITRPATDSEISADSYQNNSNSMFNEYGLNKLGASMNDYSSSSYPKLNLGKYQDVGYFNVSTNPTGEHTLINTNKNPANYALYKEQLNAISKLNPEANINRKTGFTPLINQNAMGGYQNKYDGKTNPTGFIQNQEGIYIDADKLGLNPAGFEAYQAANPGNRPPVYSVNELQTKGLFEIPNYTNLKPATQSIIEKDKNGFKKTGDFLKNNYGNILSYAPLLGNLTNKIEKPVTERGTRLDNTYQPQLFDENRIINQVNQNNVNKSLQESSGGNMGALRSNLLASNLNKTKALGDAYTQASNVNRDEERFKFQSELQKDQFNAQLNESYIDRKARDEGAYNSAKLAQRSAIFEDIGAIGKKDSYEKIVKEMFGYKWNGEYFVDKEGKKVEQSTIDAKLKDKK